MSIDRKKLENVHESGEKLIARCPACAEDGADIKGEHLVVFPDGKFGCVAHPNDKEHNRAIFKLVGTRDRQASQAMTIRRLVFPESKTLMNVGRLGRGKPSPVGPCAEGVAEPSLNQSVSGVGKGGPPRPGTAPSATSVAECETIEQQTAADLVSSREEIEHFFGRAS